MLLMSIVRPVLKRGSPLKNSPAVAGEKVGGGRYWTRTSDLLVVIQAL